MRLYERLLICLYPREHRREFAAEMLAVHRQLWAETTGVRARTALLVREGLSFWVDGLQARAAGGHSLRVVGALGAAFALQWIAYGAISTLFHRTHKVFGTWSSASLFTANPRDAEIVSLVAWATVIVVLLVPYLLFLSRRLRLRRPGGLDARSVVAH
jgi:hypothetical protein